MSFMDSYKRLDNLCKTFKDYPSGISSYIEIMESSRCVPYQSSMWSTTYEHLKKYRYIRNRIAHENEAWEEALTTSADADWLDIFYGSVMNSTDPIAEYYKLKRAAEERTIKSMAYISPAIEPTPQKRTVKQRLRSFFLKLIK